MNLGTVYLQAFMAIIASSFVLSLAVAGLLRFVRPFSWRIIFAIAVPIWLATGCLALSRLHQPLFAAWHKRQNHVLPADGCLTYDPDFTRLYATYRMTRPAFEAWVVGHPWNLHRCDDGLLRHDGMRFGIDNPELCFETDAAPNGRQLRVYFESGIVYISYNSM